MSKTNEHNETTKKGYPSNIFASVIGAVLAILLVVIAVLTVHVNVLASRLLEKMQNVSTYQQTATELQTNTAVLAETANSFIQTPVVPNAGNMNLDPIKKYAEEFTTDRRAHEIAESFKSYDVTEDIIGYINTAADGSTQMLEIQTHAISLIVSVYPFPDEAPYNKIPLVELTEQEMAMPDEARLGLAKQLITQRDYALLKANVNQNIDLAHRFIQEQFDDSYKQSQQNIKTMRTILWLMIALITAVFIATFVLFYRWMVIPLQQYESDIKADRKLKKKGTVRELFSIVTAYNELICRREKLEAILRTAAETDALTGLPNRYRLEQNTMDIDRAQGSFAVVLFDVNFLKQVNDTLGHLKGDQLLRTAADCIKTCFGMGDGDNCYRFGGDEFAAILQNTSTEDVKDRIEHFLETTKREEISVSVGYAYESAMRAGSFDKMWKLADKRMYEHKKRIHEQHAEENN